MIQFKYGEDGFDPMCLVKQDLSELEGDVDRFIERGGWNALPLDTKWSESWQKLARSGFVASVTLLRDTPDYAARLPLDVRHIFHALMEKDMALSTPTAKDILRVLEIVFRSAIVFLYKTVRPSLHNRSLEKMVMYIVLRDLQPAYILPYIQKGRLNPTIVRELFSILRTRWERALVQPGEKTGVIAAQSLGQLAMQATLNTYPSSSLS